MAVLGGSKMEGDKGRTGEAEGCGGGVDRIEGKGIVGIMVGV